MSTLNALILFAGGMFVGMFIMATTYGRKRDEQPPRYDAIADAIERLHAARQQHLDDLREALRHERERTTPDLTSFARTLVMGTPEPQPAVTTYEIDPEAEATRRASEAAVQRGMSELREAYRLNGQEVDDDTLRNEVEALFLGISPRPPS